jgi:hypothetical protein
MRLGGSPGAGKGGAEGAAAAEPGVAPAVRPPNSPAVTEDAGTGLGLACEAARNPCISTARVCVHLELVMTAVPQLTNRTGQQIHLPFP